MTLEMGLFEQPEPTAAPARAGADAVDFIPTPGWFADAMVELALRDVGPNDVVLEPTCGDGAILRQIPPEIAAFGVELDAGLAQQARTTSGREVIVGDVLELDLPYPVTRVIGNPPYRVAWLNRFLTRYHRVLPEGGEITLLLPAFALQTSRRTSMYAQQYGIEARSVPRDIFPGFNLPLSLVTFRKERERRLIGLAFYHETADWHAMNERMKAILTRAERNVWVAACADALEQLGGRGTVEQIARLIEPARPTATNFWRQAIRKALRCFPRIAEATYALPTVASAAA